MSRKSFPAPAVADAEHRIVRKRLADGTIKEYRYPRRRVDREVRYGPDSFDALLEAYLRSPEYLDKAPATKANYAVYLKQLYDLGHLKARSISRSQLLDVRDAVAVMSGNGAGTLFGRVASAILSWGVDRGRLDFNPMARVKALPGGVYPAWTDSEIEAALAGLDEPYRRVVVLALYTGQRRGDLIGMTWAAYDGATIRLRQQKGHRKAPDRPEMLIPAHPDLRTELAAWKEVRSSTHILTSPSGNPWTGGNLSREMDKRLAKLGLRGRLSIHGLRKVAATRLAEAGCSAHEIASIAGHSTIAMVQHYTRSADQGRLAVAAIGRLPVRPKNGQ